MTCRKCTRNIPEGAPYCPWCGVSQQPKPRSARKRGNGQGTVYRRASGNWQAEFTYGYKPNGKRDYDTKGGFRTKSEALEYLEVLKGKKRTGRKTETLASLWEVYSSSAMLKLSASKQGAYNIAYKKLAKNPIVHSDISLLTIDDLQTAVNRAATTYYTAKDIKNVLSHLYNRACAQQAAPTDLSDYIALPKLDETEPEPFTEHEIALIWTAYEGGDRMAMFLLIMIYTGMMPGELRELYVDNIHLDTQEIVGVGIKTKIRKRKPILIASFMVPVFEDAITSTTSRVGRIVDMNKDRFYAEYKAAKLRIGLRDLPMYSCRHSTATALALNEKVAPSVIQRIMRHAKFATTQRYIHPDETAAIHALDTLSPDKAITYPLLTETPVIQ